MRRIFALGAAFLSACAAGSAGAPGVETILAADLRADLHFLASDRMRGRLAGTPEVALAAEFIKSRFERMGLAPAGPDGSFFQPFDLVAFSLGDENAMEIAGQRLAPGKDFCPLEFSATARARGALVWAGFGIVAPRFRHDDYKGQDLGGKIVLALLHEPGERDPESPFEGVVPAEASAGWRKALFAQERGAAGILFVADVHNHREAGSLESQTAATWPRAPRRIERFELAVRLERIRIPAAQISVELAARLVAGSGRKLEELSASAEAAGGVVPLPLPGPEVDVSVAVKRRRVPARNVVGLVEGSDPRLRSEAVVVCAHHDHDGADGERIFNGADDNGSGTVGLLEVAEACAGAARAGRRPRRTILFAAWDAEERGLLGAWQFVERPLWPLEKIVAVLNMDMIGRSEEVPEAGAGRFRGLEAQTAASNANALNIIGGARCPDLRARIERANRAVGLELKFRYDNNVSNLMRRSDHWPFIQEGIPGVWFFTGLHPDYHTPGDRPERIDYAKMERVLRLLHRVSWDLAGEEGRPALAR
jgi:hypothetical protein